MLRTVKRQRRAPKHAWIFPRCIFKLHVELMVLLVVLCLMSLIPMAAEKKDADSKAEEPKVLQEACTRLSFLKFVCCVILFHMPSFIFNYIEKQRNRRFFKKFQYPEDSMALECEKDSPFSAGELQDMASYLSIGNRKFSGFIPVMYFGRIVMWLLLLLMIFGVHPNNGRGNDSVYMNNWPVWLTDETCKVVYLQYPGEEAMNQEGVCMKYDYFFMQLTKVVIWLIYFLMASTSIFAVLLYICCWVSKRVRSYLLTYALQRSFEENYLTTEVVIKTLASTTNFQQWYIFLVMAKTLCPDDFVQLMTSYFDYTYQVPNNFRGKDTVFIENLARMFNTQAANPNL